MSKTTSPNRFTPEFPDPLPPSVRAYVDSLPTYKKGRGRYPHMNERLQNERGYAEACALVRLGKMDWPDLRPAWFNLTPIDGSHIQHKVNDLLAEARPDIPRADWRIVCRCAFPFYVAEQDRPTEAYEARVYACPHCGQQFQFQLQPNGERLGCLYGDLVEDAGFKALHNPTTAIPQALAIPAEQANAAQEKGGAE